MTDESGAGQPRYAGLGKWLAAGQATFVAIAGAIGITSGSIQRIFRNNAGEAVLWLGFIAFGILMGVLVSNGTGSSIRMQAGQLMLAGLGTVLVGLAALWTVAELYAADGPLAVLFPILDFLGELPPWLFGAMAFLLLVAWVVAWILATRGIAWPKDAWKRLRTFFTESWGGLFWIGVTGLLFLVLSFDPTRRALAAVVGLLLVAGAIVWAVGRDEKEDSPGPPAEEAQRGTNVGVPVSGHNDE